jgi:NAD-dependent deacetylase
MADRADELRIAIPDYRPRPMTDSTTAIEDAIDVLTGRDEVLVFTGAGISTESGIPDFRGPDGVWTKVDPDEFTLQRYLEREETRIASWRRRADAPFLDAVPNRAHHALVELWGGGHMVGCVTQNIDGLHQRAGLPSASVVELHGNVRHTVCMDCGRRYPTVEVLERVDAGEADPRCEACGGILKVGAIFFGEMMPTDELARAHDMAERADSVLVIGSTLSVFPAAGIPLVVVEAGHPMVIVNQGETEFDGLAEVKVDMAAGDAVPPIVAGLTRHWRAGA